MALTMVGPDLRVPQQKHQNQFLVPDPLPMTLSKMRSIVEQEIVDDESKALFLDDFDEALIGSGSQYSKKLLAVYSASKIIKCLIQQGMTEEEALDYYSYNISCAWVGDGTPFIVHDYDQ